MLFNESYGQPKKQVFSHLRLSLFHFGDLSLILRKKISFQYLLLLFPLVSISGSNAGFVFKGELLVFFFLIALSFNFYE